MSDNPLEPLEESEDYTYPPGFPLSSAVYEQGEIAEEDALQILDLGPEEGTAEERADYTNLVCLFPYEFLDPDGVQEPVQEVMEREPLYGQLRQELKRKIGVLGHHVEFVPSWTDPQWDARFIYTGKEPGENDGPEYEMYARQGMMQMQRPALREEDAIRNPTDAAKRYGIDPNHVENIFYGNSGVTPMQPNFSVQLPSPRETPSNQGVKAVVDKADYDAVYDQFRNAMAAQGGVGTEDDFRQLLMIVGGRAPGTIDPALAPNFDAKTAYALLQYTEKQKEMELREEYQRLIFSGNAASEV
jgi:hypothetical protein